jgi:ATP-dependent phosphofructokinase / diphosphate-dependent phosphofructokinase
MDKSIERISICTGGGDAPGLNAVIYAVVHAATRLGWKVIGIRDGYDGVLFPDQYADGGLVELDVDKVKNIAHLGGTILGATNRGNPFRVVEPDGAGGTREVDRSSQVIDAFRKNRIDAHVAIGGDGSLTIALQLQKKGLRLVGVPKTIDNDLGATFATFGFSSAVSFATECLDRLHMTAQAHRRIIVVEVMGRYAGWIALYSGVAGGADVILIPEIPYDLEKVARRIRDRDHMGARFSIVVAAEGAKPIGGTHSVLKQAEGAFVERLGGVAALVAAELERLTGKETRSVVLGHLQRGGAPTSFDRILATRFGARAVELLMEGTFDCMVAFHPPDIVAVPLEQIVGRTRTVPPDFDVIRTARAMGIAMGD